MMIAEVDAMQMTGSVDIVPVISTPAVLHLMIQQIGFC